MAAAQTILFEDIFDIQDINPQGKTFEKVNRIHCRGKSVYCVYV